MNTLNDDNLKIKRLLELDKSALPPDGGPDFNRLIFARSPYLLQHAENPVDWRQWGDEAFAIARKENKPVFLSIGYATCHWCHVMEHESFEDSSVAEVLNRNFISVKVDREERPDVDDQFMTVAQMALEGGAGWPLSVFLDHDRKPFYISTYIPKTGRSGMPGIIDILEKISEVWRDKRDVVEETCETIISSLSAKAEPTPAPIPESGVPADALRNLEMIYDREAGGFGSAPKFPRPIFLSFLMRKYKREGDEKALEMVRHTLRTMRRGGIYDQFGYGFHRYSVDRSWLVPHFEKMLYDQGMLAISYLEAFQITGDSFFREVAEEIFTFVKKEMTSPEGAFYSAIDADSEGAEGKYYLWTPAELHSVLGVESGEIVCRIFDITEAGNFEGENIPNIKLFPDEFAAKNDMRADTLRSDLEGWRNVLLKARNRRIKPLRDEKILSSWNGLMIAALAKGYAVTRNTDYLEAALTALTFIKTGLTSKEGRLMRSCYGGESSVPAFLEDYTFIIWALLELHQATLDGQYLAEATALCKESLRLFVDESSYGLFDNGIDSDNVLVRKKSSADGVIPSGNSVAAMNFIRLGKITGKKNFLKEGEGILRSMMGDLLNQPLGYLHAASALDYLQGTDVDITIVGKPGSADMEDMLSAINRRYIPGLVLRFRDPETDDEGHKDLEGNAAVYICSKGVCRPPVVDREIMEKILDELA